MKHHPRKHTMRGTVEVQKNTTTKMILTGMIRLFQYIIFSINWFGHVVQSTLRMIVTVVGVAVTQVKMNLLGVMYVFV